MADRVETFFTHRVRMQAKIQRLFDRYPQYIDGKNRNQLNSDSGHLRRTSQWGEFDMKIYEEDRDGTFLVQSRELVITFTEPSYTEFSGKSSQGADIRVRYAAFDEAGTVKLPDETEIKSFNYGQSKTIYSFRSRSIKDNASGVDLIVEEDEAAKALIVRDYPGATGFAVPVDLNVYREVDKFEELLKRH